MSATAWNIPMDRKPEHRELHRRMRQAAYEDERSAADIIREAAEQWLDRREADRRRAAAGEQS